METTINTTITLILPIGWILLCITGCNNLNPGEDAGMIETVIPYQKKEKIGDYWEYYCPTPNVHPGKNKVKAIVLHHTATPSTLSSLQIMTGEKPQGKVSCHVLIAPDGTRYVLADPEAITWHAGFSTYKGTDNCNRFTVGIECQGNTLESPLTKDQIRSAIDYCRPIMRKYRLKPSDIITHQQIRDEYIKRHPKRKVPAKVDITIEEYDRFIQALLK